MNLKQWRLTRELTMAEASVLLGLESARTYQRYETGENRPDAPLVEKIMSVTDGGVMLEDLHRQRLDWLKENKPEAFDPHGRLEAAE
jgi:transcriptional regulator with XRE-family HTH domain